MTVEIFCSEVFKGLNKTRGLFLRYRELQNLNEDEDLEFTTIELRNSLRSIEWDLEDLEDTLTINEKNQKLRVDPQELNVRRQFISATKNEIKSMKDRITILKNRDKDITAVQVLLTENTSPKNTTNNISNGSKSISTMRHGAKYSKLENLNDTDVESSFLGETISIQQKLLHSQDEHLDVLCSTIGTLKTVSQQIGVEIDEQSV